MLTDERKDAVRAALRKIVKLQAAKKCPPEFRPGTPVVIAIDDELVAEVVGRVTAYRPPVVLAIYFPKTQRLELLTLAPTTRGETPDDELVRTHRNSTIGMAVDAGNRITVPQQWDEVFEARRLEVMQ